RKDPKENDTKYICNRNNSLLFIAEYKWCKDVNTQHTFDQANTKLTKGNPTKQHKLYVPHKLKMIIICMNQPKA
ncbi:MAG: hypothetical protein Q8877_03475, partial [Sweet potato little leaf phytoplasma]|nr:hypothetical protein [Sweet potato little leaf phytoplasma]